jgi:hypothetical protein
MPRRQQTQYRQIEAQQPYMGEYSALAEQFLRKKDKPIYSVGQGFVEAGSDIAEAYMMRKAMEREKKKEDKDFSDVAMAQRLAMDPGLARDKNSGALYSAEDFGGLQTQGIDPMSAQQRGAAAYGRLAETNPRAAMATGAGNFADLAQQFEPPKQFRDVNLPDGSIGQRNPDTNELNVPYRTTAGPAPSPLGRMIAERDALPPGDPRRSQYDAAIMQQTSGEGEPLVEVADPNDPTRGIMVPRSQAAGRNSVQTVRDRMPRVKTYYDEEGNPLTLDANDPIDQATIKERSLVEAAPSETERTSKGFLDRMLAAEPNMQSLVDKGFDPSNFKDKKVQGIPLVGNYLVSEEGQLYRQAQEDWVRAKLRKESGAVIGDDEMEREIKTYFPQPGDSKKTQEQKATSRKGAERQLATTSGLLGRKYLRGDVEKTVTAPAAQGGVPQGIDPGVWQYMTPEERALWK